MVFGYYAAAIGRVFFPNGRLEFASLMKSLMTFGAGFLMRPLGGESCWEPYIDHHGRRKGLLVTLGLMAIGTASIACTPSFATIGFMAPTLILLGRLLQGLSAGVELGGASVYLAEIATPNRKGFFTSWQSGSQQVAVMDAGGRDRHGSGESASRRVKSANGDGGCGAARRLYHSPVSVFCCGVL